LLSNDTLETYKVNTVSGSLQVGVLSNANALNRVTNGPATDFPSSSFFLLSPSQESHGIEEENENHDENDCASRRSPDFDDPMEESGTSSSRFAIGARLPAL